MPKQLNTYRGYSALALKNKANIPAANDISVGSDYIQCSNIKLSDVKTTLSETTYSLVNLCRSSNVNIWSQFGSILRSYSHSGYFDASLVNAKPYECKLGDFAGYNHDADTPGWGASPPSNPTIVWVNSDANAVVPLDIVIGEFDYVGADGICGVMFDDLNAIQGYKVEALSGFTEAYNSSIGTTDVISEEKTGWSYGTYIVSNYSGILDALDIQERILCFVPNTSTCGLTIKIKTLSTVYYFDTETDQPPSPWINSNGPLTMDWDTGYCTIGYDIENESNIADLHIYAVLYDWENDIIGSADFWNGAYTAFTPISGSVDLGMADIPEYGYKVIVYIEES